MSRKVSAPQNRPPGRTASAAWPDWLQALALIAITALAYWPAYQAGFIWDDDAYVTENWLLTAPDGWWRIWFTAHHQSQYFPLVYTTLRIEHALWGLNPIGYHVVNVLLHGANAALVWLVLRRLAIPGAWVAAAIFALHPVQVESVAWVTELKNTQSTFFYLLALLAWVRFLGGNTAQPWRFYALAIFLHALALLSKTTACTLPAALVLAVWLRGQSLTRARAIQIAPFVLLGLAAGLVSIWWENHLGTYNQQYDLAFSWIERLLIATRAVWFYLGKLIWPAELIFSYPKWELNPRDPLQYLWAAAAIGVAVFLWLKRRKLNRGIAMALVFFVATLSPMLGFVSLFTFYYTFVADHYQYLACLGPIALFAAGARWLLARRKVPEAAQAGLAAMLIVALGALTWRQTTIYRDSETLWRDTIRKNPGSWMGHSNLGRALLEKGRRDEAVFYFQEAVRLAPDNVEMLNNYATLLSLRGETENAIAHFRKAVAMDPNFSLAHNAWGAALADRGKFAEALVHYQEALKLAPDLPAAHRNAAEAYAALGRFDEAIGSIRKYLERYPYSADALNMLGALLGNKGDIRGAQAAFREAIRADPKLPSAHINLAQALAKSGELPEAIKHFEEALRIDPNRPNVHARLAAALVASGDLKRGAAHYEEALRRGGSDAAIHAELARILVQLGRFEEAAAHTRKAGMK